MEHWKLIVGGIALFSTLFAVAVLLRYFIWRYKCWKAHRRTKNTPLRRGQLWMACAMDHPIEIVAVNPRYLTLRCLSDGKGSSHLWTESVAEWDKRVESFRLFLITEKSDLNFFSISVI